MHLATIMEIFRLRSEYHLIFPLTQFHLLYVGFNCRYNSVSGLTKTVKIAINKENHRRIMMHFSSGSSGAAAGWLARVTVTQ